MTVLPRTFIFRLAGGGLFLYEVEVARRREAPRREFFWPGAAHQAGSLKPKIEGNGQSI
jgi:hypothetical protein